MHYATPNINYWGALHVFVTFMGVLLVPRWDTCVCLHYPGNLHFPTLPVSFIG